ncbi:MAG: corrinoid protein [Olsenella sp.]|jgi:dimethylamine corrinoid protein
MAARSKEELVGELRDCVVDMEDERVADVAREYVDAGYDVRDGIFDGLVAGMNRVAELYEEEEYFIPELLICSDAMYNGLDVMRPMLEGGDVPQKGTVVIGVVQGDTHDIGKNLVKIMLESSGYRTVDLGRDIAPERFVEAVREEDADVVAMSTLMSTSMANMGKVVEALEAAGLRDRVKVIVGGGPISQGFADKIGADGYSRTATDAVKLLDRLLGYDEEETDEDELVGSRA